MESDASQSLQQLSLLFAAHSLPFTEQAYAAAAASLTSLAATATPLLVAGVAMCGVAVWVLLAFCRNKGKQSGRRGCEIRGVPGAWVRPLSNLGEVISAVGAQFGTFNMAQVLWLSSSQSISGRHIHLALKEVATKVEVLQLSVVWRRLWPWYRRMPHLAVDFSVCTDDPMTVCSRQLHTAYRVSEGPLWRARLVPLPPAGPGRHQAALVLTLHHVITDGTTNMLISRDILEAINAIAIDQDPCIPARALVPALSEKTSTPRDLLPALTFVLSSTRTALATAFSSHSLTRHLPRPATRTASTKVLQKDFSVEMTKKLLHRCKEAGVKVHSCMTAAAGLALHRTVQQYCAHKLDALKIIQEQAVNIRRYFSSKYQESAGAVAFLIVQEHSVRDGYDAFWSLARTMQQDLYRNLEVHKTPLRSASLGWLCSAIIPINFLLTKLGCTNFTYSHINSSNMGNLQPILAPRCSGPVQLSGLLRATAGELAGSLCCLNCQTLEGRLLLSLDYFTNKITDDAAEAIFHHITRCLTEVADYGTLTCLSPHTARGCNADG